MGNKNIVLRLLLASFVIALSGCPGGGGGGDVNLTNQPSTDNPIGISLTHSTMNGKTDAEIAALTISITDSSGYVYYNTPSVTITGTCSLGVSKVVASVNGSGVSETATCDSNSNFTWSKTFSSGTPETGTTYDIVLKPANGAGTEFNNLTSSQYITKKVVIDDNTPAVISNVSVTGGVLVSGVWQVSGTGSSAVASVTADGPTDLFRAIIDNYPSLTVTYTAGSQPISFSDTVTEGVQKTFNVIIYDRAGNASTTTPIVVNFGSSLNLPEGDKDIKTLTQASSNNNGADAILLKAEMGGFDVSTPASSGNADTLYYFMGLTGYSTQNP